MSRRNFLKNLLIAVSGVISFSLLAGGCLIAPLVSPKIKEEKSQPWRCEFCGHLTRSEVDLTNNRCPRCKRKGFFG